MYTTIRESTKKSSRGSYHNPGGGAEVQLDDEAVPAGQEGDSCGWHQQVWRRGRR